jgi:hypothetical protein
VENGATTDYANNADRKSVERRYDRGLRTRDPRWHRHQDLAYSFRSLVAGRFFLVCGTLLLLMLDVARGAGSYQSTRDGKTLVWNSHPNPDDVATWLGARNREGYAHGFGRLVWYTKELGFDKPQLYARYWGRMVDGKLEGPVNVHSKRKTDYAIFIDGTRVTGWTAGTAPTRATARWSAMVANRRRSNVEPTYAEDLRRGEPEPPAVGPRGSGGPEDDSGHRLDSIQDLYSERWPKIDIDDSLRLLAFPPRSLRVK